MEHLLRGDGFREEFGERIATATAGLPLRVLLHGRQVLLFHPTAGERADGHLQKICEGLSTTHATSSCCLVECFEKVSRFGMKELYFRHAADGDEIRKAVLVSPACRSGSGQVARKQWRSSLISELRTAS